MSKGVFGGGMRCEGGDMVRRDRGWRWWMHAAMKVSDRISVHTCCDFRNAKTLDHRSSPRILSYDLLPAITRVGEHLQGSIGTSTCCFESCLPHLRGHGRDCFHLEHLPFSTLVPSYCLFTRLCSRFRESFSPLSSTVSHSGGPLSTHTQSTLIAHSNV